MYIVVCNPPIDTTNIKHFPPCYKRRTTTGTQRGQTKNAPPVRQRKVKSLQWTTFINKGFSYKKYIPLHSRTLQANRMPSQTKIVQKNNLDNLYTTSLSLFPTKMKEAVQYAISDSGATGNFLVQGAPVVNKKLTSSPLKITPPNGKMTQSTHTCNLDITWLPNTVMEEHIVPGLSHSALISTRKFTDSGFKVIFDIDEWRIHYKEALVLTGKKRQKNGTMESPY